MSDIETHKINPQGKKLLEEVEKELSHIKLCDRDTLGNRKYEKNEMLDNTVMPLLANLGLDVCDDATAYPSATYYEQHLGYTAWHISNSIPIRNTTGPAYLIPIRISGSPCLNPGGPLQPGWYTCYTVETQLDPELDCIFVGTINKRD